MPCHASQMVDCASALRRAFFNLPRMFHIEQMARNLNGSSKKKTKKRKPLLDSNLLNSSPHRDMNVVRGYGTNGEHRFRSNESSKSECISPHIIQSQREQFRPFLEKYWKADTPISFQWHLPIALSMLGFSLVP